MPARIQEADTVPACLQPSSRVIAPREFGGPLLPSYTTFTDTALGLLAESHISIHTWPERGYAAADLFTCGDIPPYNPGCKLKNPARKS